MGIEAELATRIGKRFREEDICAFSSADDVRSLRCGRTATVPGW